MKQDSSENPWQPRKKNFLVQMEKWYMNKVTFVVQKYRDIESRDIPRIDSQKNKILQLS